MLQDLLVLTLHLGPMGYLPRDLGHAKIIVCVVCVETEYQKQVVWDLTLITPKGTAVDVERVNNWVKYAWIPVQKSYARRSQIMADVMWITCGANISYAKRLVVVYAMYLIILAPILIFVAMVIVNMLNEF